LCLFHIYINAIGITTYEYVRAHRVALERSAREMSEPTTSTTGGGAAQGGLSLGMNPVANSVPDDGWNVDEGSVRSECPQKCRRLCVRVQIEPAPQQNNQLISNGVVNGGPDTNHEKPLKDSPVRNGLLHNSILERTDHQERRPYKPLPPPVPMPSVSTVPRLPLILSVDGVARNYAEERSPAKDIEKVSQHLDRVTHYHGTSEFRDQIYVIDGD
jgi:hypothetical protein